MNQQKNPMQITTSENGKAIKELWLPGDGNADNTLYRVGRHDVISITLQATHHGDHNEFWAHVITVNTDPLQSIHTETSINLRQVTSIVWA